MLVLALGAHPEREWHSREVLTYHGGRDGPNYRLSAATSSAEGGSTSSRSSSPPDASWPLPLYDLGVAHRR